MEEKILVKSNVMSWGKIGKWVTRVILFGLLGFCSIFVIVNFPYVGSALGEFLGILFDPTYGGGCIGYPILLVLGLNYFMYKLVGSIELVVTDKRIYGCAIFGRRLDYPLDAITSVGTCMFHGITVTTSSGAMVFTMLKNNHEIYKIISDLLVERQGKSNTSTTVIQEVPQSNADELKKFKELLDMGVITKEEFDAKKKQLLGL